MKMTSKKHRLSTSTIAISFIVMFIIGFFAAYNIANIQHNFFEKKEISTQQEQQLEQITGKTVTAQYKNITTATTKVVAVSQKGEGVMGDVTVEITPGTGMVLINTNPFVEPDTQYSAVTAVDIAKEVTGVDLQDKNVIIDFTVNGTVIGGPSAGAAMTITTIAAIEDKQIKQGIAITGTIQPDGTIGKVNGILEKGQAAVDNNYHTFLIPKGQNIFTYYERQIVERQVGKFVFQTTKLVPKTVNLQEYFKDKGLNVIEVNTIQDAEHHML